ncbi:hypothetical protein [Streptomyces chlorus]|uniref:hypothetical protein n=1 Tax=Streptomyces chlorus TaxID=887452 RepID=UPI0036D34DBC
MTENAELTRFVTPPRSSSTPTEAGRRWRPRSARARPHWIRIAFPPEDGAAARRHVFAAVRRMRCEVTRISASDGVPLPAWDTVAEEDA